MNEIDGISLEEIATIKANEIKKDPFSFRRDEYINSLSDDELFQFEYLLEEKVPNLVITHRDTDTPEDLSKQLKKIKEIYLMGKQPCTIDFSKPKVLTKDNL